MATNDCKDCTKFEGEVNHVDGKYLCEDDFYMDDTTACKFFEPKTKPKGGEKMAEKKLNCTNCLKYQLGPGEYCAIWGGGCGNDIYLTCGESDFGDKTQPTLRWEALVGKKIVRREGSKGLHYSPNSYRVIRPIVGGVVVWDVYNKDTDKRTYDGLTPDRDDNDGDWVVYEPKKKPLRPREHLGKKLRHCDEDKYWVFTHYKIGRLFGNLYNLDGSPKEGRPNSYIADWHIDESDGWTIYQFEEQPLHPLTHPNLRLRWEEEDQYYISKPNEDGVMYSTSYPIHNKEGGRPFRTGWEDLKGSWTIWDGPIWDNELTQPTPNEKGEVTMSDKRIVNVVISDSDRDVPVTESVLYRETDRITDVSDDQIYMEVDTLGLLKEHNAKRAKMENDKGGKLKPIKVEDLTRNIQTVQYL